MAGRERLEPPALSSLERQLLLNGPPQDKPSIGPMPQSSVLSKVKMFLPHMQEANAQLQQQMQSCDPAELDIEHIPEDSSTPVIEMDLACGLLDLKDNAALAAAQRAIATGQDIAIESFDGAGSSDSDSGGSSSSDDDSSGSANGSDMQDSTVADSSGHTAAAHSAVVSSATGGLQSGSSHSSQQQQQQQQWPNSRRKVKTKRPTITELPPA